MLAHDDLRLVSEGLPFWEQLTPQEQQLLQERMVRVVYPAGMTIHENGQDCTGLMQLCRGRLRAYMLSETGKEITLYRLFAGDICVLSASCVMQDITFDFHIEAEQETEVFVIPPNIFRQLSETSLAVSKYAARLISARLSDVMWVMEQVVFMSLDRRLALFLLEQSAIEGSTTLVLTHEAIAKHLGSAREVVTRMLKYFQQEGLVTLSRGTISITDPKGLRKLT